MALKMGGDIGVEGKIRKEVSSLLSIFGHFSTLCIKGLIISHCA